MRIPGILATLAVVWLPAANVMAKDTGFYVGGSVGSATIEQEGSDPDFGDFELDESEFAYKLYGGYQLSGMLAVEGGYIDLGSPSSGLVDTDLDGWNVVGILGLPIGPIRAFGKAGGLYWSAETGLGDVLSFDDDGFDFTAGAGVEFALASFAVRGEIEYLDVLDDTWLYTVGATITF